ncbi:MAG: ABC transporter ATP-binding protein [Acidobacteriota bacterium]
MGRIFLQIKNLIKVFNDKKVLEIEEIYFEKGKIHIITGPNGAGKTTLMNILSFLNEPDSGEIIFEGGSFNYLRLKKREIMQRMAFVSQNPYIFKTSVKKNIEYGLRWRNFPEEEIEKKVKSIMDKLEITHLEKRKPKELSGGEIQMIALARALVLEPDILFLDEPTANMDKKNERLVESIVKETNLERNITVFFATNNLHQAYRIGDTVITLINGRVISKLLENLYKGILIKENENYFFKTKKLKISVPPRVEESQFTKHISIAPEDILVSRTPIESSARNSFKGRIVKIEEEKDASVKLLIDGGEEFIVKITRLSFNEMRLNLGEEVYLTFKTSSVRFI